MSRNDTRRTDLTERLKERLAAGFAWNLLGSAFNQGSTVVVNILLARLFGRESFGEFALVQSTLLAFSSVFQLSLGFTATRYLAEVHRNSPKRAGRILGLCSLISICMAVTGALGMLLSAHWLASSLLSSPQVEVPLAIAAIAVALNVFNGLQAGILAGLERYREIAKAGVLAGCAYLVVCVMAGSAWGVNGAVAGLGASALFQTVILSRRVRLETRALGIEVTFKNLGTERPILTGFALPAAASGLSTMPALWLANALLVREGGGYGQMALFSAATSLRTLIVIAPILFNNVGLSLLNSPSSSGEEGAYRRLFRVIFFTTLLLAIAGAAVVTAFGSTLLSVFGRDFRSAYSVLLPLCAAAIFEAMAVAVAQIVQTEGRMWKILIGVALPRDVTLVTLAKLLAAPFGARGVALAHLGSCVVAMIGVTTLALFARHRIRNW